MRSALVSFGLACALFAGWPATAATLYVANETAGSLSIIDEQTNSTRNLPLDILPHNLSLTPDGRTLLLTGMPGGHAHGGHGATGGRLLLIDADQANPASRSIEVGGHPGHVVTNRDGSLAFVTDADSGTVLVVDLAAGRVAQRIKVGGYPHGLRLAPDGNSLAVANRDSNDVSLIDVARLEETARIAVGKKPVQVAFAPDGQRLFVSLSGENAVAAVDLRGRAVSATYPVGPGPIQLAVTPDGRLLVVANQGTRRAPGRTVSILDAATGLLIATPEVGKGAHGVSIARDGSRAYVSNAFEDSVSVIDLDSHTELTRYRTEAGPNGIEAH